MDEAAQSEEASRRPPLCREPWQNYYILRRGILPCCYGYTAIAPMEQWATAWNSPALQEIRSYLARHELSPYCLLSPACPIVQRHSTKEQRDAAARLHAQQPARGTTARLARLLDRLLSRLPARIRPRRSP